MGSTTPHSGSKSAAGQRGAAGPQGTGGSRPAATKRTRLLYTVAGVIAVLVAWQLISLVVSPISVPSPADTAVALAHLAWGSKLWIELLITLKRLVVGLAVGAAAGWVLGVLAGIQPRLRAFLEPLRWLLMTIPAVIVAGLAMLWFGLGDFTVMFIVAVIVLPTMYVNTLSGVLAIDPRLTEMGRVYRFSRRLTLSEIYLPGIASPALAGLTLAAGIGVRAVVLGEVLGAMSGIGHAFSRASSLLETEELFAWIVVLLALLAAIEFGVLRPLDRRVTRWRKVAQ